MNKAYEGFKCQSNTRYAIEKYLTIFNKVEGDYKPFKLLNNQEKVINTYENFDLNAIKKYRQSGISSITEAFLSIKLGFAEPDKPECVIFIGCTFRNSTHNLKNIKRYLNELPRWIWGPEYYGSDENEKKDIFVVNTKDKLVLPNGSMVRLISGTEDSFKGYTPTYLVIDEAAYIKNTTKVYESLPLHYNTKIFIYSTPNGFDGLFRKIYMNSILGKNRFKLTDLNWWDDERYNKDLKWILHTKRGKMVDLLDDVPPASYDKLLLIGYKPTNMWYKEVELIIPNHITHEVDAEFVI